LENRQWAARPGDHPARDQRGCALTDIDEDEGALEPTPPRETTALFGHDEAERTLLDSYRGARLPHAWLLSGPAGSGEATLAYRIARFVLAHPYPGAAAVRATQSLEIPSNHPVTRRVAAQAHPDLLPLERTINEKTGKLRQFTQVDDVRRIVRFFGSTAGEGGWRVAIVDTVDELNPEGANALLKVLEEPPRRALLLLVNHSAGRLLPTIRSRCRVLSLRPLAQADVARAAAAAISRPADDAHVVAASALAEGSVRRALALLDRGSLDLHEYTVALLDRLPTLDARSLHALGDRLYGTDPARLAAFMDILNGWLAGRLNAEAANPLRCDRLAQVWEEINAAARDVEAYNLERKPLVFELFRRLADAVR